MGGEYLINNTAPVINSYSPPQTSLTINEGENITFTANASDPDGTNPQYRWNLDGVFQSALPTWAFYASYTDSGDRTVTLEATDGQYSVYQIWYVTVNNVNRDPIITSFYVERSTVETGGSTNISVIATDLDGDSLTYSWHATGGTIVSYSNSSVSWTAPTIKGSYNVTVTISDSNGGIVEDHAVITVADNDPPFLTITAPTSGTTVSTPTITVTGTASDPSGIASVTVNNVLANGTADFRTWSANATLAVGENTITVVATDNDGCNTTETVTVYRVESFTFVHMTDVHIGAHWVPDDEYRSMPESIIKFTDTLQAIKTESPEFILSPGDLVEWNKPEYFKAYMNMLKSIDIPVYNTPGNHDRRTSLAGGDDNLAMYNAIVTNPPDNESLNDGCGGYYVDKHGYRFIGLDSGADHNVSISWDPPIEWDHSPEGNGLTEAQLTKLSEMNFRLPKIIFMHHPAISDSDDESVTGSLEPPVTDNCPPEYGGNDACIAFNRCKFIDYCINNNVIKLLPMKWKPIKPGLFRQEVLQRIRNLATIMDTE
jgi:hypothetical protein